MKKEVMILLFIFFILNINFILASFEIGNPSHLIEKQYPPSSFIKGWINLSLNNEPANSSFKTNFGDSISLIDLLNLNSGYYYNCIPYNCESRYISEGGESEKSFNLNYGESKIFGFEITGGEFISANDFSLNVTSNAPEFDYPQLFIDILADDSIEWQSYKPANNFKPKNYGCFETGEVLEKVIVDDISYCEKITLPPTPNVTLGAEVIADPGGVANFTLSIEEVGGGSIKTCYATATTSQEIKCSPSDFKTTEEKDFFVCIKAKTSSDSALYKINSEKNTPICGFSGTYNGYTLDFEIFAQADRYAPIGSFILNDTELEKFGGYNIESNIENYIAEMYGNNCSKGCVVPIKFTAKKDQNINIKDFNLMAITNEGAEIINSIYNLTKAPASITSDFQKLYLDKANFSVPSEIGEKIFSLTLNNQEIFSEGINITEMAEIIDLKPKIIPAAYPTTFTVTTSSGFNITKYTWDFGNGDTMETTENKITYAYPSLGKYNLTITISYGEVKSSRTFTVEAVSPEQKVNELLSKKSSDYENLKNQIENLPLFYQISLQKVLNLSEIEDKLTEFQQMNAQASSDEDYINLLNELLDFEFPSQIFTSAKINNAIFFPLSENINLDVVREISGEGNYSGKDDKYIDAILSWNIDNINTKVDFERISAINEEFEKPLLNIFKVTINKKTDSEAYLIIPKLENLKFERDYSEEKIDNYFYIHLKDSETVVTFSTTEDVDFTTLPVFISPAMSELSIPFMSEESKEWVIKFIIALGAILFGSFVVYIILQEWYRRKYESYLFKNRNYLYNIAMFIQNSKKAGITDKKIVSSLKKAGWRNEQIRYAMRKYYGKRTGMFEIPIREIFKVFKKKEKFGKENFYQSQRYMQPLKYL